jgi:hypothetical protein
MLKKDLVLSGPREIFQIECMDVLAFPVLPSLPTLVRLILRNIKVWHGPLRQAGPYWGKS